MSDAITFSYWCRPAGDEAYLIQADARTAQSRIQTSFTISTTATYSELWPLTLGAICDELKCRLTEALRATDAHLVEHAA